MARDERRFCLNEHGNAVLRSAPSFKNVVMPARRGWVGEQRVSGRRVGKYSAKRAKTEKKPKLSPAAKAQIIACHLGLQGSARRVCSRACSLLKDRLLAEGIAEPSKLTVDEQIDMLWKLLPHDRV